jgi:hypothetical protein
VLTVGVATVTATAVAFGPSVQEPTPAGPPTPVIAVRSAPVDLAAQVQPLAVTELPNLLVGWVERFIVPPSASNPFPAPQFPPTVSGTGIDSTIKNVYNAIEPWVRYGFELATYAVGWIPYVGWLSGQIMIFYNFGERIARSITFNIADWLGGNVNFVQGLINVGVDTVNSFIQLGIDEWNFFLPPLPPLPPFPFAATATKSMSEDVTTLAADNTTQLKQKRDAVKGEDGVDVTEQVGDAVEEAGVDVVKEPKAPKEPKPLKAPKQTTEATTTQIKDSESNEDSTGPKKATPHEKKPNEKKADKGAKAGTESSTSDKDTTGKSETNKKKKDDE